MEIDTRRVILLCGGGQGSGNLGVMGVGKCTGGRRREGGRWDTCGGRSLEKVEINFVTLHKLFCNRKKHTEARTTQGVGKNRENKIRKAGN